MSSRRRDNPIETRIPYKAVLAFAQKLWPDKPSTASNISSVTQEIIREYPSYIFSGKSKAGIIGGLFYLLSLVYDQPRTQKEIANLMNSSIVTIRASYYEWQRILAKKRT